MSMYICIAVHMIKILSIPACLSSSYVVLHVVLVIPSARLSQPATVDRLCRPSLEASPRTLAGALQVFEYAAEILTAIPGRYPPGCIDPLSTSIPRYIQSFRQILAVSLNEMVRHPKEEVPHLSTGLLLFLPDGHRARVSCATIQDLLLLKTGRGS